MYTNNTRALNNVTINTNISSLEMLADTVTNYAEGIIQRDNKRKVEHLKNVPIGSKSRRRRTGLNMYDALRSNLTQAEILSSYDVIDNYLKNKVPASDIVQTFKHISPKAKRVVKQTKVFNVKPTNTPRQGGNFDYGTITQEEAHQNCVTVDQLD